MATDTNKRSDLPNYTHKHFVQMEQMFGEKVNGLHLLEETDTMYNSIMSWSFCMSDLNVKKDGFKLSDVHPTLTDTDVIMSLDMKVMRRKLDWVCSVEVMGLLKTWYPDKEIKINFNLKDILSDYAWSRLTKGSDKYDHEMNEHRTEMMDYILPEAKRYDYTEAMYKIGKHIIVCPYIFPEETLGRCDGEFMFVVTDNKVYFDIRTSI